MANPVTDLSTFRRQKTVFSLPELIQTDKKSPHYSHKTFTTQIFPKSARMIRLFTTNAEENVDAKTERWSNVVAFEKNSQTCLTQNAFVTSRLLKQLRPTQLTSRNTTTFLLCIEKSLTLGSTILSFSCLGIVGTYYNTKIFCGKSIAASPFLTGIGVWWQRTLSPVLFGTRETTVLVETEFQGEAV